MKYFSLVTMMCFMIVSGQEAENMKAPDHPLMDKASILEKIRLHRENKFSVEGEDITLEKVRYHEANRVQKMKDMLEERKKHLQEHEAGHRKLSAEEYDKYQRQVVNFEKKLEQREKLSSDEYDDMLRDVARHMRDTNRFKMDL